MDSPSSRSESVPDDDSWCASRRRPQNQTKRSANASAVAFSSDRPDDATFPAHSTAPLPQRKPTLPNSSRPGRTGAGHQPVLVQVHGRVMAWEPVRADPEPVLPGFKAWEPYTAMQSRTNSPTGHRNGIKWQHRRPLCLAVHPDKNPSAAADGAFKVVQAAYDIRRVACGGSRRAHGLGLGGRSCSVPLPADSGQYVESVLCKC